MSFLNKGELTSSQIIAFVLAIGGFIVVLFFLVLARDTGQGQDQLEICRLSVLTRATSPHAAQAAVPLACTTAKICVSVSGRKDACPQFLGEPSVMTVRLDGKTDEDNARIIERVSAEAMYSCWSVMGKGQLDLFGTAEELVLGSTGKSTCVVCSRVAYSQDINESILTLVDLQRYLENALIPGTSPGITYLQAFTDRDVQSFASLQTSSPNEPLNLSSYSTPISGGTDKRQIAFVFSQVKAVDPADVLRNLGYAAVGSTFVLSRVPGSGALARAIIATPALGIASVVVVGAGVAGATWNAYEGQSAAAGYCGRFTSAVDPSKEASRRGCSLVQAVNYNVQDVNALCTTIQGNP